MDGSLFRGARSDQSERPRNQRTRSESPADNGQRRKDKPLPKPRARRNSPPARRRRTVRSRSPTPHPTPNGQVDWPEFQRWRHDKVADASPKARPRRARSPSPLELLAEDVLFHHVKLAADRAKGEQRSRSRSPSPRARSPPRRPQSAKPKQTPRVPAVDEPPLTRKQKNNRRRAKLRAAKKELAPYLADGDDVGDSGDPPARSSSGPTTVTPS